MSGGLQRWIAGLACRVLLAVLPGSLQSWGRAVHGETASIPDDAKALRFALGSLFGLLPRACLAHLRQALAAPVREERAAAAGATRLESIFRRPRAVGIACAMLAVALGLAYLAMAGAPTRYLAINVGALVLGLVALGLVHRTAAVRQPGATAMVTAIACALLATALLGDKAVGAARWLNLGGLSIQPSLVLLPLMLVAFARFRGAVATCAVMAAAAALAIQPDRAMAGMMAVGLAILAAMRPDRHVAMALLASVLGFAVTLVRSDNLPAVPYVDQILYSAFEVHPAAGAAVLAGSVLLLLPAVVGWFGDAANRTAYVVFGAAWSVAILAAALGNYPTPIVGYGGSAIMGYVLSLLALPRPAPAAATERAPIADGATPPRDAQLLAALA